MIFFNNKQVETEESLEAVRVQEPKTSGCETTMVNGKLNMIKVYKSCVLLFLLGGERNHSNKRKIAD